MPRFGSDSSRHISHRAATPCRRAASPITFGSEVVAKDRAEQARRRMLFGVAAVHLVTALSIGLLISTVVDTQQQAMFVTFFIISGYLLLSGLFTPIDSMAPWVQVVSQLNPVRHFVTISRAILMKGAGVRDIARPLAILCMSAVIALSIAVRQYNKRVV